jgi:hydrophobic/amphiphilic exporter-1 (mainly G- bacteria), HAE1 family
MQWLARVCVDRPVFTWVLSLCLLVVGVAGLGGLPVDRFPNIDMPVVVVVTPYRGASPEQVENEVTNVLEESINSIGGLSELRSSSYEGLSVITAQFELDKDTDVAAQELRDRVDRVTSDLPKGIDTPRIEKTDPDAAPLLYVALRGTGTPQELTAFAEDEIKARLESRSGVGSIRILGAREREIRVELDPMRLLAHDVSVADVQGALMRDNLELPGGGMDRGDRTLEVRVPGRLSNSQELAQLVVAKRADSVVRLSDVARVSDGAADAEALASYDGEPVVLLSITRQTGTNAIAVADSLRAELHALALRLPPGFAMDVVRDESVFPRNAVAAVEEHLVLGALFAILVVLSFLRNGRSTVIAALAIPVSIVGTFAAISALGLTLNMITLLALTLAVGIVIDDAIVVLENVIRFLEERELSPREATLQGTKQIGLAVLATTLSLVAVFLPVAFMGGIMGRFMASFGITMTVAVLISLFVAFTLTPMLTSRWLVRSGGHARRASPPARQSELNAREERARYAAWQRGEVELAHSQGALEHLYGKALAFSMQHRWLVGLAMLACLGSVFVVMPHVPTGFLPTDDEARFEISLEAPEGTSLARMELLSERLARDLRSLHGVAHTVVQVGASQGDMSGRGANDALVYVSLLPEGQRLLSQTELMEKVRKELLPRHARELEATLSEVSAIGGSGAQAAPIQYVVRGPELDALERYADALADALRTAPGVADADTTLRAGRPELRVVVDRERSARLGVSVADVADALRILVGGLDVTELTLGGERYDVNLRASAEFRARAEDLDQYQVRAQNGTLVRLSQLVRVEPGVGPSVIEHIGRQRSVTVYANVLPGSSTASLLDLLDRRAEALHMPPSFSTALTGQAKEFGQAARAFGVSMLLSFVFMYLVIAAQFESWLHPLTILASLPLTVPFALLSLVLFGQSLNVFSALGVLVLFAIVKKNAILQVDHMLTLEREGFSRPDAVMMANRDRLRPILMTTIAFVAGMVPMMVTGGAGSGSNHAIAGIVLGGQSLALLLTLLATPVLYTWLDDLTRLRKRLGTRLRLPRRAAAHI